MNNFEVLAKRVQDAGLGQIGRDIFVDAMPSDCKQGVLIKSPLTGIRIDHELPQYYKPRLQIIVRAQTEATGRALANEILELFTVKQEAIWRVDSNDPGIYVRQILPETLPIVYPRSDGNGLEFSMNFDFVYVQL